MGAAARLDPSGRVRDKGAASRGARDRRKIDGHSKEILIRRILAIAAILSLAAAIAIAAIFAGDDGPAADAAAKIIDLFHDLWGLRGIPIWDALTVIFVQGGIAAAAVGVLVWTMARPGFLETALGRRAAGRIADPLRFQRILILGVVAGAVMLALSGIRYDYYYYLLQWGDAMAGLDPWDMPRTKNAYGPGHLLMAPLAAASGPLPQIVFAALWGGAWLLVLGRFLERAETSVETALKISLALVLGPYFVVSGLFYSTMDIVPAAAVLLAVHLRLSGRFMWAGAALSIGVLTKFYPIAVLPFLMIRDDGRLDWRPAASCVGATVAGFGATYLLWGSSFLAPFDLAAGRGSKHLSIFRYLRGDFSFLRLFDGPKNVDFLSLPLLATSGFITFLVCWRVRTNTAIGAALAMVVVLLFYKVAHFQFFAVCFLTIAYWWATDDGGAFDNRAIRYSVIAYLGSITVFAVIFAATDRALAPPEAMIREIGGLPAFLTGLAVLWTTMRHLWRGRDRGGGPRAA